MVFLIFTTVVFIAELIIAFTIIYHLIKFDKHLIEMNHFIEEAKPNIKCIVELMTKISEQVSELFTNWVEKFYETKNKILLKQLERVMTVILLWSINKKVIRKFNKSKILKAAWKGLTLLQSMV